MRELKIAVANTRKAKTWNNRETTWEAFIERISTTQKTIESIEEFLTMKRGDQDEIKDVGGYVMGHLKQGKRRAGSVLCRSCVTLDMPNITPHVCRHTYCSNQARAGMNPKTLQYLMGHSDISVTMNVYTHLGLEDAAAEMARMKVVEEVRQEQEKVSGETGSKEMTRKCSE